MKIKSSISLSQIRTSAVKLPNDKATTEQGRGTQVDGKIMFFNCDQNLRRDRGGTQINGKVILYNYVLHVSFAMHPINETRD